VAEGILRHLFRDSFAAPVGCEARLGRAELVVATGVHVGAQPPSSWADLCVVGHVV